MKLALMLFATILSLQLFCQQLSEYEKGLILVKEKRFQEAYSIFKTNEKDDVRCALEVGKLIYYGQIQIVPEDLIETYSGFSELAQKGNKEARVFKGYMLLYGFGCIANEESALNIFKSALKDNNFYAYTMLGYMFFNGTYLEKNMDSSLFYLSKSKEYGDTKCYSRLAQIYAAGIPGKLSSDSLTARKILTEGCQKGDSYSCSGLASYDLKKMNEFNYRSSSVLDNLNNAIEFGENPLAKNMLLMLLEDEKFRDLPKLKFSKYDKAALLSELMNVKNGFDSYNISRDYIYNKPNKERALYFLKRAEILRCPEAFCDHGVFFSFGNDFLDIETNSDSAKKYFNISIDLGFKGVGNYGLGLLQYNACNYTFANLNKLADSVLKSALIEEGLKVGGVRKRVFLSQIKLDLLDENLGDWQSAIDYLQLASDEGIADADYLLGVMYGDKYFKQIDRINSTPKGSEDSFYNAEKSRYYFERACKAGLAKACK